MFSRFVLIILILTFYTVNVHTQNLYSKDEVDIKLELLQEKISAKLDAVERENSLIDIKIAAQDKQIANQDKHIENLKFIFGVLLSAIGVIVAAAAFFIDHRNKERLSDLEEELKTAKDDAIEELNRIKEIANLEVRLAKAELNEIKAETKNLLKKQS